MNVYQMGFLIFLFLPLVLSIVIDILTFHIKKLRWIKWLDSVLPFYLLALCISGLALIYIFLGDLV
uniref:DUF1656 domain-containing protein n=1 Tax=Siphoviridae sp. ctcPV5 TaxID=2827582 RepID=A0A8S5LL32_9CAUD|nr:MAG TPA: hypothetical protein [Siphoviridae sp. ctcPV5]